MAGGRGSASGNGGSSGGSRPPSAASSRVPSPFGPPAAPPEGGQQRQGSVGPPLRGRRRLAGSEAPPLARPDAQRDPQAALLPGSPLESGVLGGGSSGGPLAGDSPADSPRQGRAPSWRSCLNQEPLLLATLAGVLLGIAAGAALRPAHLSPAAIALIGFPGELMLRLLKMLVLPLVAASMVSGVCSLRQADDGGGGGVRRLARLTAAFYVASTAVAILVGIALVVIIHPGRGAPFDAIASAAGGCAAEGERQVQKEAEGARERHGGTAEALMGVARQVVPDNVAAAAVDMNVLGLITFSLMLGLALSSLGPAADGVIAGVSVLNAAVQRMVAAALWVSPVGIGCLIAASMLRACDLLGTLAALGLWVATVLAGLALFACVLLPGAFWALTGRSPAATARAFAQPLLMAFGTSTSAAALPLAMQAAKELGCEGGTVDFFLPLGTAVNMNGTALYEATTAIFIAQAHGVALAPAELLVVAATASLAAVGAPAIPSAGLVTMLVVLQAVQLEQYAADLAIILAIDWLLDRVRTMVNLLSDALGLVLVDHFMQRRPRSGGGGLHGGKQIPYIQLESMGQQAGDV